MSYSSFDTNFWKGKRVFITGHTGFKGCWLNMLLEICGAHTKGYSLRPDSTQKLFHIFSGNNRISNEWGDIRDLSNLRRSLSNFEPEIVFHLAAQPLVRESYKNPIETYSTNVMGTVNILEAARASQSMVALVNITSDKCYENREMLWGYREDESMGGGDPYSSSKGCSELITAAMRRSFYSDAGTAFIASARAGNVIGGGDWSNDRLIPDIVKSLSIDEDIIIRNPKAVRPWQHVLEPLSGYMMLAERLFNQGEFYAQAWNFGPNSEGIKSVKFITEYLVKQWGGESRWLMDTEVQPYEAQLLNLDISKSQQMLGWFPKWNLTTALNHTLDWYKAHIEGQDMYAFTKNQISEYIYF